MHQFTTVDDNQRYERIISGDYTTETALAIGGAGVACVLSNDELNNLGCPIYFSDSILSISVNGNLFGGDKPTIGCATARIVQVKMRKPKDAIPRSARLAVYARVKNNTEMSQWIPKGVFFVDTRNNTISFDGQPIIELNGYDAMIKSEASFELGNAETSDAGYLTACAHNLGVEIDERTLDYIRGDFSLPKLEDYSIREILGFIAAMHTGNFVISDCGKLLFVPLKGSAEV